jgi:hypothetical protein
MMITTQYVPGTVGSRTQAEWLSLVSQSGSRTV